MPSAAAAASLPMPSAGADDDHAEPERDAEKVHDSCHSSTPPYESSQ